MNKKLNLCFSDFLFHLRSVKQKVRYVILMSTGGHLNQSKWKEKHAHVTLNKCKCKCKCKCKHT